MTYEEAEKWCMEHQAIVEYRKGLIQDSDYVLLRWMRNGGLGGIHSVTASDRISAIQKAMEKENDINQR